MTTLQAELAAFREAASDPAREVMPSLDALLTHLVGLHEPAEQATRTGVGAPVSRAEALEISRETMRRAEAGRLNTVEADDGDDDWLAKCERDWAETEPYNRVQAHAWAMFYAPRLIAAAKECDELLRDRQEATDGLQPCS